MVADRPQCPKNSVGQIVNVAGFNLWALETPHELEEVLQPGYFNSIRDHGIKTGDWMLGNTGMGTSFAPVILVVTVGKDVQPAADIEVLALTSARVTLPPELSVVA